jgi:hypothetical protein
MDPSMRRPPGPAGSPGAHPSHHDTTDLEPIPGAADGAPWRARIGRSRVPLWSRREIVLLLLGVITLPWLPIHGPPRDQTRARRVRGIGGAPILSLAFSPDGATIATIQVDRRVAVRGTADGRNAHTFLDYRGSAQAFAFSPDGRSLAVGGIEPDLFLHDLGAGGALHPLGMAIRCTKCLVFSPDGRLLAASSYLDHEIQLWDLAAGRERARLKAHQSPVISLAFAPDGRSLASGTTSDPEILRWDLDTGRPRRRLDVPPDGVYALACSPDGGWLASASRLEGSGAALGPGGWTQGPAHRQPFAPEGPGGVLAGWSAAGHHRPRWPRAAVGRRDRCGAAPGR